jgi:hypothetical protein
MKSLKTFLTDLVSSLTWSSTTNHWPPLPKHEFLVGRAAADADVQTGVAAICFRNGDKVVSEPIPVLIPQYAYYSEGRKRKAVIVIQAERFLDRDFIGARYPDGRHLVGFFEDFELLGATPPVAAL